MAAAGKSYVGQFGQRLGSGWFPVPLGPDCGAAFFGFGLGFGFRDGDSNKKLQWPRSQDACSLPGPRTCSVIGSVPFGGLWVGGRPLRIRSQAVRMIPRKPL